MQGVNRKLVAACAAAIVAVFAVALAIGPAAEGNHSTTERVSVGQINGNGTDVASFAGMSADGSRAFFTTTEQLVSADTDTAVDVYERANGTTTLVSIGPAGGNAEVDAQFVAASGDGSRVFFTTQESLVAGDTDSACDDPPDPTLRPCRDVYERSGGTTTLVSAGQINGNGAFDVDFNDVSSDGTRVFFATSEKLVSADTDSSRDLYQRSGGTTTLVSAGQINGNGAFDVDYSGMTPDGGHVYFATYEKLVSADTDSAQDVYDRSGGTTTLVSAGQINGNGLLDADFSGVTDDGSRVFFVSAEQLVSADTDSSLDVYQRSGGTTTLISVGQINGNGAFDAGFSAVSSDGQRMLFVSYEQLSSADTDSSLDLYERSGGSTSLVSAGQINGNGAFDVFLRGHSNDLTHVFFTTSEKLVSADTDSSQDVYERSGGTTTQVSTGPINGNGAYNVAFRGNSADGSRVFFTTRERLVSADSDPAGGSCVGSACSQDIYERTGGTTYLISLGPLGDNGNKNANYGEATADGARVFYTTAKQQVSGDTDTAQDVYSTTVPAGQIRVVLDVVPDDPQDFSFTAGGGLSPSSFSLDDDSDGTLSNLRTFDPVLPGSGYSVTQTLPASWFLADVRCDDGSPPSNISVSAGEIVTCTFTNSRAYPRPKGAAPIRAALVPAFQPCTAPNRIHGPPLAFSSCNPPAKASSQLTIGSPDANGQTANFSGYVKYEAYVGNPGTPADEADMAITASLVDVRRSSDLADYTGELQGVTTIRLTDRINDNGISLTAPGTVQDTDISFTVPCATTASMTVGSTCSLVTTLDAVIPGAVPEGKRSVFAMDTIRVFDGGPDGDADTPAGNTLFATQGVFIP